MIRIISVRGVDGESRVGYANAVTKQGLENMYRAQRYFAAIRETNGGRDSELLSQATALAVNYPSLDRYCTKEGIL